MYVYEIHQVLKEHIKVGVTTMDLERITEEEVKKRNTKAAFKGYMGYPFCLCTSVNDEVVHGMPSNKRVLNEGDIVGVDFGIFHDGFYGDSANTYSVGNISETAQDLMKATKESLERGIEAAVIGNRLQDISFAVQQEAESAGFSVVRNFVGHGIGRNLHEPPQLPNFGKPGKGPRLKEGMVLACEPMINEGSYDVKILDDGWTAVTVDGKLSAHYEHTFAITENGPYILSRP